jgi:hypothetical protein
MSETRRRALIFPREHGAWGILLVPLASGAAVGLLAGGQWLPLAPLTIAALTLFWLRTPVESWLGTTPLRAHTGAELQLVRRTVLALAAVAAGALIWVFGGGRNGELLWIGAGAALAFLAQAFLKKACRSARTVAQMIGAAGLTAAAPAAYYVATGRVTATAWSLWIANLLFAINQIHFVQLRIHASRGATRAEKLSQGAGFLVEQAVLMALIALACARGFFSWYAAVAFLPALIRGFAWFARRSRPLAVRALGWSELGLAAGFGILLVFGLH